MNEPVVSRKVRRFLWPTLIGVTLAACSIGANLQKVPDSPISACGPEAVLFHVANEDGPALPKVRVRAVTRHGLEELGETSELGQICLAEGKVNSPEMECLLFCRSGYFCGQISSDSNHRAALRYFNSNSVYPGTRRSRNGECIFEKPTFARRIWMLLLDYLPRVLPGFVQGQNEAPSEILLAQLAPIRHRRPPEVACFLVAKMFHEGFLIRCQVLGHEIYHVQDFFNGKSFTDVLKGDFPSSATGPGEKMGNKIFLEKPDLSIKEARKLIESILSDGAQK